MAHVRRDGFIYSAGRFYTERGRIERVNGASLRFMFLQPPSGLLGVGTLKFYPEFVRGQLQHYSVAFDESEFIDHG